MGVCLLQTFSIECTVIFTYINKYTYNSDFYNNFTYYIFGTVNI